MKRIFEMKIKILKDKKGGEKIFSFWWFAVIAIVGVGIVSGVFIYYSSNVDVRDVEAEILFNKVERCIVQQGILTEESLEKGFNLLNECGLNENIFSRGSSFYFNISFLDENQKNLREDILEGDFSFEKDCELQETDDVVTEKFPKCVRRVNSVLYYENNQLKKAVLKILTASNQYGIKG